MAYLAQNFADSFGEGLGFGLRAYQAGQANRRANEQAQREAEDHALRMGEARRQAEQARRIEEARARLAAATTEGFATGTVPGLSRAAVDETYAGQAGYGQGLRAVQEMGGDYQREMGRFGLPEQQARYDTSGVGARQATDRDINRLMQQYALVANDINAYRGLRAEAADIDFKEAYVNAGKEFDELLENAPPEQRAQLLEQFTRSDDVPGAFGWEPGEKGEKGTYWYMAPGSKPISLTADEARTLYQLRATRDIDPYRAEQEIAKLQGNAREAAFKMLQLQTTAAGVHNAAVRGEAEFAQDQERLGLDRQALQDARERAAAEDWQLIGVSDDNKGLLQANRRTGQLRVRPAPEGFDAKKLFSRLTGERAAPEMTPVQREEWRARLEERFGGGPLAESPQARRAAQVRADAYINIQEGRITPEEEARNLASDTPDVQLRRLQEWASIDSNFARQVQQLLQRAAPSATPAPAAPPARAGLPPPIRPQNEPAPPPLPTPERRPVGQGAARLPWEQPTGGW